MKLIKTFLTGTALISLGGCATVFEGTGQSVAVSTNPTGAACTVSREGVQLGSVNPTPGSIRVEKSKNDLSVTCSKEGRQTTTVSYSPTFNGTTFGNIVLGGGIGAIVDASTGANYDYPAQVSMELSPMGAVASPNMAPVDDESKPKKPKKN
jgi:hypothetical protein